MPFLKALVFGLSALLLCRHGVWAVSCASGPDQWPNVVAAWNTIGPYDVKVWPDDGFRGTPCLYSCTPAEAGVTLTCEVKNDNDRLCKAEGLNGVSSFMMGTQIREVRLYAYQEGTRFMGTMVRANQGFYFPLGTSTMSGGCYDFKFGLSTYPGNDRLASMLIHPFPA
ncbi:unnamed protein product [Phaeothamnion confervicola]